MRRRKANRRRRRRGLRRVRRRRIRWVRREGGKEKRKGKNQKKRMKGKCKKKTQKKNAQRTIKGISGDKEEQKKQQEQNELPILEIQMSKGKGRMTNKTYETIMKTMQLMRQLHFVRKQPFPPKPGFWAECRKVRDSAL